MSISSLQWDLKLDRALWTLRISQLKLYSRTNPNIEKKLLWTQSKLSRTRAIKTKEKWIQLKIGEVNRARKFQKVSFHCVFFKKQFLRHNLYTALYSAYQVNIDKLSTHNPDIEHFHHPQQFLWAPLKLTTTTFNLDPNHHWPDFFLIRLVAIVSSASPKSNNKCELWNSMAVNLNYTI